LIKYFVVPEAQNYEPFAAKKLVAREVVSSLLRVLSTINLNDESWTQARKVCEIGTNWMLSSEAATELLPTQVSPEELLSIGKSMPQLSRS
jgi:hypothetical protein